MRFFSITTIIISCVLSLLLAEIILRIIGLQPWEGHAAVHRETLLVPDETLGWRTKSGLYLHRAYSEGSPDIRHRLLGAAGRATAGEIANAGRPSVTLVGGSTTFGQAISDQETFAWKLQGMLPDYVVKNLGVSGYGSLQSLLQLKEVLSEDKNPEIVLYGYDSSHGDRNIASPEWIASLARYTRGSILLPYAELDDDNAMVYRNSVFYRIFPFREYSSLFYSLEKAAFTIQAKFSSIDERRRNSALITNEVIAEMKREADLHGATFYVVILYRKNEAKDNSSRYFQANDINFLDCNPGKLHRGLKVKGEGHPNDKMNTIWANCIYDGIPSFGE